MQTGVFGTLGSVELVRPTAAQVAYIHQTYLDLAMSGERSEAHYRDLPRADGDGGRVG